MSNLQPGSTTPSTVPTLTAPDYNSAPATASVPAAQSPSLQPGAGQPVNPDHLSAATNAAPSLSPSEVLGVAASSSSPQDAAVRAQTVASQKLGDKLTTLFHKIGDAEQTRLWATIPENLKPLMISAGYRPPSSIPQAASGGWWHGFVHIADNARHAVSSFGNLGKTALITEPSRAFNAAMKPITDTAEGAIYNAKQASLDSYNQGNGFFSLSSIARSLNPVDILNAGNAVASGKDTFAPESMMYVQKELGITGQKLQLAQAMARGAGLTQLLQSVPQSQRQQAAQTLQQDTNFQEAVKILSDSGLSLGQVLFGGLNPDQMAKLFPRYSKGYFQANQAAAGAIGAAGTVGTIMSGDPEGMAGALSGMRGIAALSSGGAQALGTGEGLLTGKTADQATQMSLFGKPVNPLSGTVDGLVSWYANPLQRGIQFAHIAKDVERSTALLNAMGDGKNVEYLYTQSPNYVRFARQAAKSLTTKADGAAGISDTPNFAEARRMGINTGGLEPEIIKYWPEIKAGAEAGTPEVGIARMLADNQGLVNVLRGRLSNSFRDSGTLPYITLKQDLIDRVLGAGKTALQGNRFNVPKVGLRQSFEAMGAQSSLDEAKMMAEADPTAKLGYSVRMGRRLSNLVPVGPLNIAAPNAVDKVEQLARIGLPEKQVASYVNQFSLIPPEETGQRRMLIYNLTRDVFNSLGVGSTEQGAKYLKDWEDAQHYSANGNDMYVDPSDPLGRKVPVALGPSQTSSEVAMPKLNEVYHFARKSILMKALNLPLDNRGVDKFMSRFWKPAMLFRPAFGVRFASEEALNFMLRHGATALIQSRMAADVTGAANAYRDALLETAGNTVKATKNEELAQWALDKASSAGLVKLGEDAAAGKASSVNELDSHILAHALFSEVPTKILQEAVTGPRAVRGAIKSMRRIDQEGTIEDRLIAASNFARANNWLTRAKVKVAGSDLMNAAYNLAARGVLRSAMQDQIDAVMAHGNVFTGDNFVAQDVHELVKDADGKPIRIVLNGGFEQVGPNDPEVYAKYAVALGQIAADPFWSAYARGFTQGGHDQGIQNVLDKINRPDLQANLNAAQQKLDHATPESAAGLTAARDAHQTGLDNHVKSMKDNVPYNQTPDGVTVASGMVTQAEANRAWAERIGKHVTDTVFTAEPQKFDEHGDPITPPGPQPIELRPGVVPREPYAVKLGDTETFIKQVDEKNPYTGLAKGHIRLFKGINSSTLTGGVRGVANPARTWFPDIKDATAAAGEDGHVYSFDVSIADAKKRLTTTGGENYAENVAARQQAGDLHRLSAGHFEAPSISYSRTTDPVPNLLVDSLGQHVVPGLPLLRNIAPEHIPAKFIAPRLFSTASRSPGGLMSDFVEKGMENMVGKPANYIARHPIFLSNYSRALNESTLGLALRGIADPSGDLAHDIAMERAANDTIPFIHDPTAKSQFSVITRNLMPFWFAQEQFYKRWGKLFGTYPEAWYKLQLTMQGLSNVGFLYTDTYGKKAFVYPFSSAVMNALRLVPGLGAVPMGVGFTSEVAALNPTTALGGMPIPSLSPVFSIPIDFAAGMFHGFVPLAQGIQGPSAPTFDPQNWYDNAIKSVLPSVVNRAVEWYSTPSGQAGTESISTSLFMSSVIETVKILEANGHGPTEAQLKGPNGLAVAQQFLDRIANYTKTLIGLRALFGFFSPGTPNFSFADHGLGAELASYMATMPYQDAINTFVKLHPNAAGMEVFASTTSGSPNVPGSGSGSPLPATAAAGNYINSHLDFFKTYSQLAPWTIPLKDASGLFNATTYTEQKNLGLREPRTLQDAYFQIKYAEGANTYYSVDNMFQAAEGAQVGMAAANMTQAQAQAALGVGNMDVSQLKQVWSQWKTSYLNTHPVFASMELQKGVDAMQRRAHIVTQLQDAIDAGALPQNEWTQTIGPLMQGYAEVQQFAANTKGNTGEAQQRTDNYNAFIAWGSKYVAAYPVLQPFWLGCLMKQVPK